MAPDTSIALVIVLAFAAGGLVSVMLHKALLSDMRHRYSWPSSCIKSRDFDVVIHARSEVMRWLIRDAILPVLEKYGDVSHEIARIK